MTFVVACGKTSSCSPVDLSLTIETRPGRGQYEMIKFLHELLTTHGLEIAPRPPSGERSVLRFVLPTATHR